MVLGILVLSSIPEPARAATAAIFNTDMTPSKPGQTAVDGFPGASVGFNSTLPSPQAVLVFGSVLNQFGQTIEISVQGATIPALGSSTFFFSVPMTTHGNFTVVVFVTTPDLVPLSVSTSVLVKV